MNIYGSLLNKIYLPSSASKCSLRYINRQRLKYGNLQSDVIFPGHRHSEQIGASSPASRQGSISIPPYSHAFSNQQSVGGSGGWAAQQAANTAAAAADNAAATEKELTKRIDTIGK